MVQNLNTRRYIEIRFWHSQTGFFSKLKFLLSFFWLTCPLKMNPRNPLFISQKYAINSFY